MSKLRPEPDERLSDAEVIARVTLLAPNIILMRDVPSPSSTTVRQLFERAEKLLGDQKMNALIADLRDAGLPSAEVRSQIREAIIKLQCRRVGLILSGNRLLLVAAKFIIANLRLPDVILFNSPKEALAAFRHE